MLFRSKKCYYVPEPGKDLPPYMGGIETVMVDGHAAIPLVPAIAAMGDDGKAAMEAFQTKNVHQLHLENFFAALRQRDAKLLNCSGEEAYKTAVAVLQVIPAVEAAGGVTFKPTDFKV